MTTEAPEAPRGRKRTPIEGRKTISDQLRRILRDQDRTPYAVAQAAGVDPKVIARFLSGSRGLTLASVDWLAVALNLKLREG